MTPKRSRIRSESPLPETTPIRFAISWTTIERQAERDEDPEGGEAEARAGLGVGRDPAGVVVDVGGDDPGSEDCEEETEAQARRGGA